MTTCELYAKIITESELLQPALNEIHKFRFQHWSHGRGICGTSSGTPVTVLTVPSLSTSDLTFQVPKYQALVFSFALQCACIVVANLLGTMQALHRGTCKE